MQHKLDANLAWYKRNYRENYDAIKVVRSVLKEKDDQFPEASCPHATRLLLELLPHASFMCGKFKNAAMDKERYHVWVFDMAAGVHIDITAHQFPLETKRTLYVFKASDTPLLEKFGYVLGGLDTWNEIFETGPYRDFSLSKMTIAHDSDETLNDVLKVIKKKLKRRTRKAPH